MNEQTLKPERITKPIQLLGAWLAGLLSIDSCFLFAATKLPSGSWESGALIIAAIINVPLFLLAVFLLQTKFRPELQEDSYYSTYLSRKTNEIIAVSKEDAQLAYLRQRFIELEDRFASSGTVGGVAATTSSFSGLQIGINQHLQDSALIGKELSKHGVLGFSVFGADEPPEDRVIAISEHLSKDILASILHIAKEFKFTGYSFIDNVSENIDEDVLFGAYGHSSYQIA